MTDRTATNRKMRRRRPPEPRETVPAAHADALVKSMDEILRTGPLAAGLFGVLQICLQTLGAARVLLLRSVDAENMVTVMCCPDDGAACIGATEYLGIAAFLSHPRRVPDLVKAPLPNPLPAAFREMCSLLSMPLQATAGHPLALVVLSQRKAAYTRVDEVFLKRVGSLLELAINQVVSGDRAARWADLRDNTGQDGAVEPGGLWPASPTSEQSSGRPADWYENIIDVTNEILVSQDRDIDATINRALARAGQLAGVDRTYVYRFSGLERIDNTHEWTAPGIPSMQAVSQGLPSSLLDPWRAQMDAGLPFTIEDVDQLQSGSPAHEILHRQGVQSLFIAPMLNMGHLHGFVGYDTSFRIGDFDPLERRLLQSVANAVSVILNRAEAEAAAANAQADLVAKGERLRATLAALPDIVVELDAEGRCLAYNGGGDQGNFLRPEESIGKTVEDLVPPDLASRYRMVLKSVADDGKSRSFEYEVPLHEAARWRHATVSPRFIGGVRNGWFVIMRDITERRLQQRQIARLSKIAELTSNMVIVTDAEANIEWVNPAFVQRTGWTLPEIRGRKPESFLRSRRASSAAALRIKHAVSSRVPMQTEMLNQTRQGEEFWVSMDVQPMADASGVVDGFVSVQTDITLLKRAHFRELRDWRVAIEAATDGIAMLNSDGRFTFMNRAYRDMFGINDSENITSVQWKDLYPSESANLFDAAKRRRIISTGVLPTELRGRNRDGKITSQELSATARMDGGLLVIARDISERARLERDKARLRDQLQIAQQRETIAHVSAGIAHDLNNIFAVVSGTVSLLESYCSDHREAAISIERIKRASRMAMELAAGLGGLGRSEALPTRHDLRELVRQGVDLLGTERIERHGITLSLPDDEQPLWGDDTKLLQVIVNLCLNACESDPEKPAPVHVSVLSRDSRAPDRAPDVGVWRVGTRYSMFRVTDFGAGLLPEHRKRLFEPYFTTKGKAGTGLGLPIVAAILKENDAVMWLDSVVGQGTTVTVALPATQPRNAAEAEPVAPQPAGIPHRLHAPTLKGLHILVVDDVPDVADVLAEILETAGAVTVTLSDPEDARDMLMENPGFWSALVTDMNMTDTSGACLAEVAASLDPPVATVLVTAQPDRAQGFEHLFSAVLAKPTDAETLIMAVNQAVTARKPPSA